MILRETDSERAERLYMDRERRNKALRAIIQEADNANSGDKDEAKNTLRRIAALAREALR